MIYPYYKNVAILQLPDRCGQSPPKRFAIPNTNNIADSAPRTYMINGANDYFFQILDPGRVSELHERHLSARLGRHQNPIYIGHDLFGEKKPISSQYYMDLLEIERLGGQ